jgi:hypothetical protein
MNTPTPINPEQITAEAQISAFMYDTVLQACPYPFGSLAAQVFTQAFNDAKKAMLDSYVPPPKVAAPNLNKMAGTYTSTQDAYYRNDGNPHVPSRGVGC